jgi:hypothetical protein
VAELYGIFGKLLTQGRQWHFFFMLFHFSFPFPKNFYQLISDLQKKIS